MADDGDLLLTCAQSEFALLSGTCAGRRSACPRAQALRNRRRLSGPGKPRPIVLHGVSPRLANCMRTDHFPRRSAPHGLRIRLFSRLGGAGYEAHSRRDGQRRRPALGRGAADRPDPIGPAFTKLLLHVDEYFSAQGSLSCPRRHSCREVPVRIKVRSASPSAIIHLPIQFGPWSYTYSRGS